MKIYISIPITGHNEARQRQHADLVKAALSRAGHKPVNPFEIYPGKNPTYADHLCCDLRALADCDAIFLCDGWHNSRGCRIERTFAEEFGKQVLCMKMEVENETFGDMKITAHVCLESMMAKALKDLENAYQKLVRARI